MAGITPFLWFDDQAEEAANHYVSIFTGLGREAQVTGGSRYGESGSNAAGRPEGSVMTVAFRLDGLDLIALNGGPEFHFTEALSLMVNCETQEEVDGFWKLLSEGGEEGPCGWLKDRYGLSWQIVPSALTRMLEDPDPQRAERVMSAMLKMGKIEIEGLQRAYDGEGGS
jgi:predicted 3-demethylubiquinone-9 3-methyltransferase (glyoxalase superfamily)